MDVGRRCCTASLRDGSVASDKRHLHGFSLLELMVTLAIAAILAAIAYPSYQDSLRKGRRADGHTALVDIAARQEQYFLDNKTYASTMTALGFSANPANSPEEFYQIRVKAAAASCPITTCFLLEGAPRRAQVNDSCGTLSIDSLGEKLPTNCW